MSGVRSKWFVVSLMVLCLVVGLGPPVVQAATYKPTMDTTTWNSMVSSSSAVDGNTGTYGSISSADGMAKAQRFTFSQPIEKVRILASRDSSSVTANGTVERLTGNTVVGSAGALQPSSTTPQWFEFSAAGYTSFLIRISAAGQVIRIYEIEGVTLDPPSVPTSMEGSLTGTGVSPRKAVITWVAGANATSHDVYQNGVKVSTVSMPAQTWTSGDLAWASTFVYTVRAVNSAGTSSPSGSVSLTTPAAPTPPGKVWGLEAVAGDREVTVGWTHGTGGLPTSYRVYRDGSLIATVTEKEYVDRGLVNGRPYVYTVIALNDDGAGPISDGVTAVPRPGAPAGSPVVTATVQGTTVRLSWPAVLGADGYRIRRDGVIVGEVSVLSFWEAGLSENTRYTYTVQAYNPGGTGPESSAVSAVTLAKTWDDVGRNAAAGGVGMVRAAESSFQSMWPIIVGLIALVFLAYWVISRTKKGASGAK